MPDFEKADNLHTNGQISSDDLIRTQRDLALALGRTAGLDEAMRLCLDAAIHAAELDSGGIFLINEKTGRMNLIHHKGLSLDFIRNISHYDADSRQAQLVRTGKPVYIQYMNLGLPMNKPRQREGLRAFAAIPIHYEGRVISCLCVASHAQDEIHEAARNAIETIAAYIGISIVHIGSRDALRLEKAFTENIIETATNLIVTFDRDATITSFNRFAEKTTGYKKNEVIGKNWMEIFPPKRFRELRRKGFRKFANGIQAGISGENTIVCKNGKERIVFWNTSQMKDEKGNTTGLLSIGRDITESNKAAEELRARKELLDTVLSSMSEGVTIENENYVIEFMNKAAIDQFGNGVGRKCHEHYFDRRKPCIKCYVEKLLGSDTPSPVYTTKRIANSEELEIVANAVTGPNRRRVVLSVSRNITERRLLEEQLFHSQKIQTLGTLAGGVAHDYNNLLVGVLGFASIISKDADASEKVRSYSRHIENAARRMSDLTKQLLAFGRRGKWSSRVLDINKTINEALSIVRETVGKEITIETNLSCNECRVEADPGQMQQIVANICINAIEAMESGGTLTVRTRCGIIAEPEGKILENWRPGKYIQLTISDTGCGMNENTVVKMFEPYCSTKGQGRGLGMAAVFGIIKNHNGHIAVDTEPGKGTSINAYLPLTDKAEEMEESPKESRRKEKTEKNPLSPATKSL